MSQQSKGILYKRWWGNGGSKANLGHMFHSWQKDTFQVAHAAELIHLSTEQSLWWVFSCMHLGQQPMLLRESGITCCLAPQLPDNSTLKALLVTWSKLSHPTRDPLDTKAITEPRIPQAGQLPIIHGQVVLGPWLLIQHLVHATISLHLSQIGSLHAKPVYVVRV